MIKGKNTFGSIFFTRLVLAQLSRRCECCRLLSGALTRQRGSTIPLKCGWTSWDTPHAQAEPTGPYIHVTEAFNDLNTAHGKTLDRQRQISPHLGRDLNLYFYQYYKKTKLKFVLLSYIYICVCMHLQLYDLWSFKDIFALGFLKILS